MATRRIVTGVNQKGKSCFVSDGPTPGRLEAGYFTTEEMWMDDPRTVMDDPKAVMSDPPADPGVRPIFDLEPPEGGSLLRIFTFPPDGFVPEMTAGMFQDLSRFNTGNSMESDHPGMHTTKTIDYGIVLSGEISLELDEGIVHLKPGDVVVQRGTRHAWRNTSSENCVMAFILISSPNYR